MTFGVQGFKPNGTGGGSERCRAGKHAGNPPGMHFYEMDFDSVQSKLHLQQFYMEVKNYEKVKRQT